MLTNVRRPVRALFRVAAGPRIGFGHLVRARVLSRALGIERPLVSLRGNAGPRRSAATLRMKPVSGSAQAVLERLRPDVLVIDDPSGSSARVWVRTARRAGIPVASVHDLGTGFCGADLAIDGSIIRLRTRVDENARPARLLAGVEYTVLDAALRTTKPVGTSTSPVLIALGGGPRRGTARRLAMALRDARPDLQVRVAGGFGSREALDRHGITWLGPQPGLARELAACGAAITGGGVSLYEAVTLRTPVVAWPVVKAQHPTVIAFSRRRLATAVLPGPQRVKRAVNAVLSAIDSRKAAITTARRDGFDGWGAVRVAAAIKGLVQHTEVV